MRIDEGRSPAVQPGPSFQIEVDGMSLLAHEGETIASVLLANGRPVFRQTRAGNSPRGLFCGIGVCYDCLVVVNGTPNRRACMTPAAPDVKVQTQHGVGPEELEAHEAG